MVVGRRDGRDGACEWAGERNEGEGSEKRKMDIVALAALKISSACHSRRPPP